ncbi:hypothetical protein MRX96_003318 [Rhipicephalus microplus]
MIKSRIWSAVVVWRSILEGFQMCPTSDVLVYAGPDKFCRHQVLGGCDLQMRQSVQGSKHLAAEAHLHEQTSSAHSCVAANPVLGYENWNTLKIQGDGCCEQMFKIIIITLSGCQSGRISL